MPPVREDFTGRKFNRWTVLRIHERRGLQWYWWCKCDCGTERPVPGNQLKHNQSKSCGCLKNEISSKRLLKQWQDGRL
jgi:hypothetical protein